MGDAFVDGSISSPRALHPLVELLCTHMMSGLAAWRRRFSRCSR